MKNQEEYNKVHVEFCELHKINEEAWNKVNKIKEEMTLKGDFIYSGSQLDKKHSKAIIYQQECTDKLNKCGSSLTKIEFPNLIRKWE